MLSLGRFALLLLYCHGRLVMVNSMNSEDWRRPQYPQYPGGKITYVKMIKGESGDTLADCAAAIDMIPNGFFINHERLGEAGQVHQHTKRPNGPDLYLWNTDRSLRPPKYLIPAAFVAGVCVVLVDTIRNRDTNDPPPPSPLPANGPLGAATALYTIVWPNVRIWAQHIIDVCIMHSDNNRNGEQYVMGFADTYSMLLGWRYNYTVALHTAPRDKADLPAWFPRYNLYLASPNANQAAASQASTGKGGSSQKQLSGG